MNEAEFEEKLDKYSKVCHTCKVLRARGRHLELHTICDTLFQKTWEIWNEQPKLTDEEAMENVRNGLEEKMSQDIDNMVCIGELKGTVTFCFSDLRI